MNRLDLNNIPLPAGLSAVVDQAVKDARDEMPAVRRGFHLRLLIPVAIGLVALVVVCFSVPPVAEAVADFFSALRGTALENDSRTNIVENGFTAPVPAGSESTAASAVYGLSLQSYYLDADEIGLDFALSGPDLDFAWELVSLPNLTLEITDASGQRQVWRGTDLLSEAAVTRVGENRYDVAVVLDSFQSPVDMTGKEMRLSFDDIQFFAPLAMEDEAPVLKDSIAGPWAFNVHIDEKFAQAETVTYRVVDPEAALEHGIAVQSVEVRPSVTRIELTIDYSENDLADEANAREAGAPGFRHKLDFMNTDISVQAGGKVYDFGSSDILREEGDVVSCWREVDSMYFNSTATDVTLQITSPSMNGEVISIPLVRD
jgi:hypothetical protein